MNVAIVLECIEGEVYCKRSAPCLDVSCGHCYSSMSRARAKPEGGTGDDH